MPDPQNHQDNENHLDLLIDEALSTYAEPRAGLEARVLSHLAAQPSRRRWLPFAIAIPIVAACAILLVLLFSRPAPQPSAPQAHNSQPVPQPNQATPPALMPHNHMPQPRIIATRTALAPLPKLDVFPTPQPLTPEEQALVRFAIHAPASEVKSIEEVQQKKDELPHIAEIQIPQLEPLIKPDQDDKNEN
jgi:hypothetical protein